MMTPYLMELRGLIGNRLLLLPSVAAVIHDHAGNLLLQEKASGEGWSLPAGAIEPGETPQEAIIREVMEETGLTIVPLQFSASSEEETFGTPTRTVIKWNTLSRCSNAESLRIEASGRTLRQERLDISREITCPPSPCLTLSRLCFRRRVSPHFRFSSEGCLRKTSTLSQSLTHLRQHSAQPRQPGCQAVPSVRSTRAT
ncbi:8-oxo-dGTP pyrophosphatase MutT (NUDIX family) [Rhizobium leguminosarum]